MTSLIFSLILLACSKDEEDINLPPDEVTNIQAQVLSGTMVRITWNAAKDKNNDQISYEVVVNEKVISKNIQDTSVELDIEQFIPNRSTSGKSAKNGTKGFTGKLGLEVVLGIEIKAYDQEGGFSSESIIKNLSINRAPEEFEFANIYFDIDNFNFLEVSWTPAIDKDGDKVTYSVFLNDLELAKNMSIEPGYTFGYVYYYNSYMDLAEGEIIIKVIAKDTSGEEKEISRSYKFKETDIDLGTLSLPYSATLDYFIDSDEPDDRISLKFTISEEQGYLFSVDTDYLSLALKNSNKYVSNYNQKINGGGLAPGSYSLELINNYYNTNDASGKLTMLIKNATETDIDLGLLETPSEGSFDYDLSSEIDQKVNFLFQTAQMSGYIFNNTGSLDFALYDINGDFYYSNYTSYYGLRGSDLPPGSYRLEVFSYYGDQQGQINYEFKDAKASDQELGVLQAKSSNEISFAFDNEPDFKVAYNFQVTQKTGYSFYTNSNLQFTLLDANGYALNGNSYRRMNGKELLPGTYSLELYSIEQISGTMILQFDDPTVGDIDLGVLEIPFAQSYNLAFDLNNVDDIIAFSLELSETSNYSFSFSSGINIELKDANGNYITYGYASLSGENLPAGKYILEIKNSDYYYSTNTISGTLFIQFTPL